VYRERKVECFIKDPTKGLKASAQNERPRFDGKCQQQFLTVDIV
jgi:hypothetical protein